MGFRCNMYLSIKSVFRSFVDAFRRSRSYSSFGTDHSWSPFAILESNNWEYTCATCREWDRWTPLHHRLIFKTNDKKILSYRIFIYNWGGIFILRILKIRYTAVFCLFTLGRHGNFTAGVIWNSQICCVPHLR